MKKIENNLIENTKTSKKDAASPKKESATTEYMRNYTMYSNWHKKIGFLEKEINTLGKLDKYPIFVISAFLLKCQVIEFRLKQIILPLDLEIATSLRFMNSELKRRIRAPKDFEGDTLGKVVSVFCEFDGIVDEQVRSDTINLNNKRNQFTHHLFSPETDVNQIIKDARDSLVLADRVIFELQELNTKLNQKFEKNKN